jgi:hypothetical protein
MPIHAQATGSRVSPHLASGRPRGRDPARTRGRTRRREDRREAGATRRGRAPVSLKRAGPEQRFRVYSEEEFLAGFEPEHPGDPASQTTDARRARRLAATAMLVGAVGTAGGTILLDVLSPAGKGTRVAGGGRRAVVGHHPRERSHVSRRPLVASTAPVRHRRPVRDRPGRGTSNSPARRANTRRTAVQPPVTRYAAAPQRAVVSAGGATHPRYAEFGFER